MKRKYSMKGIVTIAITLAFVMPAAAFVNGETIQVTSSNQQAPPRNIGYHEGWPQIITGDTYVWGGIVSPVVTDLDKDGFKELILMQQGEPSKLYVFEQNGSLKFDIIAMPTYAPYVDPRGFPTIGDINNDGFEEIIIESVGENNEILIYNHNGTLIHEWVKDYRISDTLYSSSVLADLDSDNNTELIYGAWNMESPFLVVLDNQGNPKPGFPISLEDTSQAETNTPAIGNFDEDPDLEIVTISHENNQPVPLSNIRAFNNDGSLLWQQEIDSIIYNDPSVGDVNHDGYDEVIFTSTEGIHILDRYGNYLVNNTLGAEGDSSNIALVDVNDDKNLEVIFGYSTKIYTMDYNGTILWSYDTGWNAHYPPIVGDITGDGIPDIVTNSDSLVWAWNSQGELLGGFPIAVESNAYGACSVADLDDNGEIELIASSDWKWNGDYNEGYIYVWDLSAAYNPSSMEWPMFQHDPQHTGMYPGSLMADANGPYEGVTGEPIQFFGNAYGGSTPYSWFWDFGDGFTSAEQNPTHTYTEADTYMVTLRVTDAAFNSNNDSTTAAIIDAEPVLEVVNITGGFFKVKATIKNTGTVEATNVDWS
ncbi:MAG: FG-GAP-like repeat-containing protein, partial [Euryarchaeota archaeon]|nr:FG-GAP-like repeat-containing protein [Euryarchaeota archaeon]